MLAIQRISITLLFVFFLSACKGTVNISTYIDDSETPAGSGVEIYIENQKVAETDANGQASISTSAGEKTIRALLPGLVAAEQQITVSSNQTHELAMVMAYESLSEPATVSIPSINNQVLRSDFADFAIQLLRSNGELAPISYFDYLRVAPTNDLDNWVDITEWFQISANGELVATNVQALQNILSAYDFGQIQLSIYAEDATGGVYDEQINFYLGSHTLYGQLSAPPSNPALPIGDLVVQAKYLAGDITLQQTADSGGAFLFEYLPSGNWEFTINTEFGDTVYNSFASIVVDQDKNLTLNLLTTEDLLNNEPYFEVSNATFEIAAAPQQIPSAVAQEREALHQSLQAERQQSTLKLNAATPPPGDSVTINAVGGAENVAQSSSQSLTVPAGTETITLTYEVNTDEYPTYVLAQSIYNDVWRVTVSSASGATLFNKSRQVNSQLFSEPVWQSNGSTGDLVETIDVSSLTSSDVEITLYGSATNIGDDILPTYVNATLSFEPKFNIKSVNNTGGDYISIPRNGDTNTYSRVFRLEIDKPTDATITKVTAKLLQHSNGNELMTVVDETPGTKAVLVNDDTIDVTVTMDSTYPSSVTSQPPALHNIRYNFSVEADLNGTTLSDDKDSSPAKALWVLPNNVPRFGTRDNGGDGWAAKGTYEWLTANLASVPEVNDISGEHGRNIGHTTHRRGTDIDIYHFTDLTGGVKNGTQNYLALRAQTANALAGDAGAITTVTDWIEAARNDLDTLTALSSVAEVIFARGSAGAGLPNGWVRTLMETGQLTVGAQTLNLSIGTWSNTNVGYRNDHNNHGHIDLNDTSLNNAP